jgi:hypothetical protein
MFSLLNVKIILYAVSMKRFLLLLAIVLFNLNFATNQLFAQAINVTGSIAPKTSDFQLAFTSLTAAESVAQGNTLTYQITYGSHLYYAAPITVEASWGEGTIQGDNTSVDIVNYVSNSASTAYGNTSPIIDLINRKITWNIISFPGQTTDKTITFSLKTNSNYTGTKIVSFQTKTVLSNQSLVLPEISVTKTYLYDSSLAPTITTTPIPPTPTETPSKVATSTPPQASRVVTPTPLPIQAPSFTDISIRSISDKIVTLFIQTAQNTKIELYFGKFANNLSEKIIDAQVMKDHEIALDTLDPNTTYYIKVVATNSANNIITSDIYSVKTALPSQTSTVDLHSLIITNDKSILVDPSFFQNPASYSSQVVVPKQASLEFKFTISATTDIRKVRMILRNKNVLGISTLSFDDETPPSTISDTIELSTGSFIGRILTPKYAGNFEIFAQIFDNSGNITEKKIADLHVTENFTVLTKEKHEPIEGAQVILYYFNPRSKKFELLPPQIFLIKNPAYTDTNGQLSTALPQGRYMAKVRALGFTEQEVSFTLGSLPNEVYPQIMLSKTSSSFLSFVPYYWTIVTDVVSDFTFYLLSLSHSRRFFALNALVATMLVVSLTFLSLWARMHIPLHALISYLKHKKELTGEAEMIKGRITHGSSKEGIAGVDIYLLLFPKNNIVSHMTTSSLGEFAFQVLANHTYTIEVMKNGYKPVIYTDSQLKRGEMTDYVLNTQQDTISSPTIKKIILFGKKLLSVLFETLLLTSLIFEFSLGHVFGWPQTLPFFVFSLLNLLIWLIHLSHVRSEGNFI